MESSVVKTKSGKIQYIVLSVLAILIVAIFVGVQYKGYFAAQLKNLKNNHFSKGDKVYLSYEGMNSPRNWTLPLYQLVKSPNSAPSLVLAKKVIIFDSLLKRKDHLIGTYKRHEIQELYYSKKAASFYVIEIDKKLLIDDKVSRPIIPADQKKVTDEYYIVWNFTSNKIEKRILNN